MSQCRSGGERFTRRSFLVSTKAHVADEVYGLQARPVYLLKPIYAKASCWEVLEGKMRRRRRGTRDNGVVRRIYMRRRRDWCMLLYWYASFGYTACPSPKHGTAQSNTYLQGRSSSWRMVLFIRVEALIFDLMTSRKNPGFSKHAASAFSPYNWWTGNVRITRAVMKTVIGTTNSKFLSVWTTINKAFQLP